QRNRNRRPEKGKKARPVDQEPDEGYETDTESKQTVRPDKPQETNDSDEGYETDTESKGEKPPAQKIYNYHEKEGDEGDDQQASSKAEEVYTLFEQVLEYTSNYIKELANLGYHLNQYYRADMKWARERVQKLGAANDADNEKERRLDTQKAKLLNLIHYISRNDILGSMRFLSVYEDFRLAESAILDGKLDLATEKLKGLKNKLVRREVEYDFEADSEDRGVSKVTKDGKIEITEVTIEGEELDKPRLLLFDNIQAIHQGVIVDNDQVAHPVHT